MPRFYCDIPLQTGALVALPDAVARHALGALRLRDGAEVTLFNGDGAEYTGRLTRQQRGATVHLATRATPTRESPLRVVLAQGLSAGDRMDLTLQKAVELGVAAIQPLAMRRSVVRLAGDKTDKRLQHWRGVVIAACEQCGRNAPPPVAPLADFATWLPRLPDAEGRSGLLLDPTATSTLADLTPPTGELLLLAGPEGGFDPAERTAAVRAGWQAVRLGPRVLRTETAALAALAAMQALWGDLR